MYKAINITNSVYSLGVNDRRKSLFENQLPLPYGVSYNSYLIKDEKVALIDTVDVAFFDIFLRKIETLLGNHPIDYLIINHMEPDHSGSVRLIRERYPDIQIIGNCKTFDMLNGFYGIIDNLLEVKDGSELDLGNHKLNFLLTPMVHWPETMMTYDATDKILFSGDAFGCFGNLDGGVTDSSLNVHKFWSEMRRYYACIVGKFGVSVQNALKKLQNIDAKFICPTHGLVWTENINKVMALYDRWSKYEAEEGVVIAYGTMYGNTEQMAEAVAEGAVAGGVKNVVLYDVSKTDASFILSDIFKYKGLIIGSPTYMTELFPAVDLLLHKITARGVKNRIFASFGSCTWAGMAVKKIASAVECLQWENIGSVEEKQALKDEKYAQCFALGKSMAEKLKSL